MLSLARLMLSSGSKWRIAHLMFLVLVFFTLMLLLFHNAKWLQGKLVISAMHIHNANVPASQLRESEAAVEAHTLHNGTRFLFTNGSALSTDSSGEPLNRPDMYGYIINEPDKCKDGAPFLILLVTVERWQKEARQAIRQTWGNEDFLPGVRVLRLFLLGKDVGWNEEGQQSLREESQAFRDIIQQDYVDTYYNLSIKVVMGLKWVSAHCPGASYVMKTDSDMFVNTEYLIRRVLKPDETPRQNYFTGYLMINAAPIRNLDSKWYMPPEEYPAGIYPPFCSGTGYVLSADLPQKIVRVAPTIPLVRLEDVYIGLCLDKLGVVPVAPPSASDFNPWRVPYLDCQYNQIVTSHELRPGEILFYWNRVQQSKHSCV